MLITFRSKKVESTKMMVLLCKIYKFEPSFFTFWQDSQNGCSAHARRTRRAKTPFGHPTDAITTNPSRLFPLTEYSSEAGTRIVVCVSPVAR